MVVPCISHIRPTVFVLPKLTTRAADSSLSSRQVKLCTCIFQPSSLNHQDYLRNSDTGERAVIEAKREADALDKLIAENEDENETVAARRKERLKRDAVERKKQIE